MTDRVASSHNSLISVNLLLIIRLALAHDDALSALEPRAARQDQAPPEAKA
jgi:hypothetical protein